MTIANTIIYQFKTNEENIYVTNMKVQSNNPYFYPFAVVYPEVVKTLVQVMKDSCLAHALSASFSIPMKQLSIVGSTDMYNKKTQIITFQLESQKIKRLNKKFISQILKLLFEGQFEVFTNEKVLHMFNEMGYQPLITLVCNFQKSNLSSVCNSSLDSDFDA